MVGIITSWDILAHPFITIRCFGWQVFFKAVAPWYQATFLSLVRNVTATKPASPQVSELLERCIVLELRAMRVYRILTRAFGNQNPMGLFFAHLMEQEQEHADLLEIVRVAAIRKGWKANIFNPWQGYLPRLEEAMDAAEAAVCSIDSIEAALTMVIQLESSEVNQVFGAALAATNAPFVRKLRPFQYAMENHIAYILDHIPRLSPNLKTACREMRSKFPSLRSDLQ